MVGERSFRGTGRRRALSVIAVVSIAGAVFAPGAAFARTTSTTASGTCSESPNPVAVGATYTIAGSHLPAGVIVNLTITDPKGTQWGSTRTTSTGTLTFAGQASVAGSYSVRITDTSRKANLLASCGFNAV